MTEDQIERKVEILFNRIDAKLMRGEITQEIYDTLAADIHKWAGDQAARRRPLAR
jgi:hypothetical protein